MDWGKYGGWCDLARVDEKLVGSSDEGVRWRDGKGWERRHGRRICGEKEGDWWDNRFHERGRVGVAPELVSHVFGLSFKVLVPTAQTTEVKELGVGDGSFRLEVVKSRKI